MKYSAIFTGFACAFALSLSASAQVLMLDFGPTASTGTDRTNSPYHTADTSFTGTTWNTLGVNDPTAGSLLWSDGTSAGAVTVNIGATTSSGTTLGLGNTPSGSTLSGTAMTSGVYAGTAPGRDGIFTGSGSSSVRAVGLQIGGLAAGTYDIYITGRNTNTTAGEVQNFYADESPSSGDFDFSGFSNHTALTYFASPTLQNNAWSDTTLVNYAKFSVVLTGGDYIDLAVTGGAGDARGFLNSVQIVAIPEPATLAFLAGLAALAGAAWRKRLHRPSRKA